MRNFTGITNSNYVGGITALPTNINNTKFGEQPALPPSCVALTFDWANDYGASTAKPNIAVPVNIGGGGTTRQKLDNVRSVRIDNLGNNVPVYVNFPDTNYTVVAPPNSIVRENVETGQFAAFVYAEGFTTGQAGVTAVYFYNYPTAPFVDLEVAQGVTSLLASATITRGNSILNKNFGIPALGDQFLQATVDMTTNNNVVVFPIQLGFIYITGLTCEVACSTTTAANGTGNAVFESTGISGQFMSLQCFLPSSSAGNPIFQNGVLFTSGPVQWKIDATQTWRVRSINTFIGGLQGTMQWNFTFTTNPT